jgi:hypothetical protein
MEKNIVSPIMGLVNLIVPAVLMEAVPIVKTTETIKIELNSVVPMTNPWIGKKSTIENIAMKIKPVSSA